MWVFYLSRAQLCFVIGVVWLQADFVPFCLTQYPHLYSGNLTPYRYESNLLTSQHLVFLFQVLFLGSTLNTELSMSSQGVLPSTTMRLFMYKSYNLFFAILKTKVWDQDVSRIEFCWWPSFWLQKTVFLIFTQGRKDQVARALNKGPFPIHEALSSWSDSPPKALPSAAITLGLRISI